MAQPYDLPYVLSIYVNVMRSFLLQFFAPEDRTPIELLSLEII